ncbi:Pycsar system effector family protein [Gordonia alkanivorans]|uniref:Pycsar effector protein domain-containing protein n=1 Tax=Gordonia alkanivorans NBRC 16433 TaxID=1027371 RepID=F9W254_9ACTN|nr:Pycsar system effector family protein [Gordonia alkanivorans]GAA14943.1 hypothetical protein GOALK_120_00010 [Gordonia alkanivorans NBRC 16433]
MAPDPTDTAWKIHAALVDWTGKVDTKASFALTIETALLVGVITLSGEGRVFHHLGGWAVVWYVIGILLLVAGVLCAAWVVRPRLRASNLEVEAPDNFVYFGHLRHLTPEAVQDRLEGPTLLPVLSKQLVEMSKIAWTKHRLVQLSMSLAPIGVVALGICATY